MPIVALADIHLVLGRTPILTGVDLEVETGERLGVSGPNGAGKTTLLSVIATLQSPTSGDGTVFDAPLGSDDVYAVRHRIGWSGHSPALYDELTLRENLEHYARLGGRSSSEAEHSLEQVGLAKAMDRRAAACSNGMRRRADLARLLLFPPDLALFDEAQAGLDADAEVIIRAIANRTVGRGGAVVMVSHDAAGLSEHVDRVVNLTDGRLRP